MSLLGSWGREPYKETPKGLEELFEVLKNQTIDVTYETSVDTPNRIVIRLGDKKYVVFHNPRGEKIRYYVLRGEEFVLIPTDSHLGVRLVEIVDDLPFVNACNELINEMAEEKLDLSKPEDRVRFRGLVRPRFTQVS